MADRVPVQSELDRGNASVNVWMYVGGYWRQIGRKGDNRYEFVMNAKALKIVKIIFSACFHKIDWYTQKNALLNQQKFGWPNKSFCLKMGQWEFCLN